MPSTPNLSSQVDPNSPLALLDNDQYNMSSFKYPKELGTDPSLNHWITFYVNESQKTKFKTINTKQGVVSNPQGQTATINQVTDNPGQKDTTTLPNTRRNITRTSATVSLYMPPNMNTTYGANWSQQELGLTGDIAQDLRIDDRSAMLRDLAVKWGFTLSPDSLNQALSQNTRLAYNSHKEILFDGIPFRQFKFDFTMVPKSADEAKIIDNIVRLFKFYSAPEIDGTGITGRFWIYPAEFDIRFFSQGKENDFINKISTCALTAMNVNYTGGSEVWSAKVDCAPMQTNLSLTFMELELIDKARILTGNF